MDHAACALAMIQHDTQFFRKRRVLYYPVIAALLQASQWLTDAPEAPVRLSTTLETGFVAGSEQYETTPDNVIAPGAGVGALPPPK